MQTQKKAIINFSKKFSAYKIEHIMPTDPLNFVMEIGLILDLVP